MKIAGIFSFNNGENYSALFSKVLRDPNNIANSIHFNLISTSVI